MLPVWISINLAKPTIVGQTPTIWLWNCPKLGYTVYFIFTHTGLSYWLLLLSHQIFHSFPPNISIKYPIESQIPSIFSFSPHFLKAKSQPLPSSHPAPQRGTSNATSLPWALRRLFPRLGGLQAALKSHQGSIEVLQVMVTWWGYCFFDGWNEGQHWSPKIWYPDFRWFRWF